MIDAGNELSLKGSRDELASVYKKMEDLENRSKRNNIITWGLKEGAEKQTVHNSLEDNRALIQLPEINFPKNETLRMYVGWIPP